MDSRVKLGPGPHEHLKAHGGGNVSHFGQTYGVMDCKGAHSGAHLCAIHQGQSLAGLKLERLQATLGQGLPPIHSPALVEGLTLTQKHQRQVCQGSQIPTRSHGTLFVNHGMNPPVEEFHEVLDGFPADARMSPCQILDTEGHHGPHRLFVQHVPHRRSMAPDDIVLKLAGVFPGYGHIAQRTETRCYTINGFPFLDPPFNQSPCFNQPFNGFLLQAHPCALS